MMCHHRVLLQSTSATYKRPCYISRAAAAAHLLAGICSTWLFLRWQRNGASTHPHVEPAQVGWPGCVTYASICCQAVVFIWLTTCWGDKAVPGCYHSNDVKLWQPRLRRVLLHLRCVCCAGVGVGTCCAARCPGSPHWGETGRGGGKPGGKMGTGFQGLLFEAGGGVRRLALVTCQQGASLC
jgi:hypothetical protein